MKVYHATTKKAWKEIQKEGVLWGRKNVDNGFGKLMSRCTYLALEKINAVYSRYGLGGGEWAIPEVMLEVEIPKGKYPGDYWQIRYYEPISISKVKKVEVEKKQIEKIKEINARESQ